MDEFYLRYGIRIHKRTKKNQEIRIESYEDFGHKIKSKYNSRIITGMEEKQILFLSFPRRQE